MNEIILNDSSIRSAFRSYLEARKPSPCRILDELRIQDGRNIADIVAIYRNPHCYEIKGETDDLRRLINQAEAYNSVFPRISIITTLKHLDACMSKSPEHWGVILANSKKGQITFSYLRNATHNSAQKKSEALMLLWRSELTSIYTSIYNKKPSTRLTREDIATAISNKISTLRLNIIIATMLSDRIKEDRAPRMWRGS